MEKRNLQKTIFLLVLCIIVVYIPINSIMVVLQRHKEYCINKEVDFLDIINFSYMVSGEREDLIHIQLFNENKILYDNQEENYGYKPNDEYSYDVENSGIYKLCFLSMCPTETVVSFEFYTNNESGHILNLAKNGIEKYLIRFCLEIFDDMYKNITIVSLLFEEIERNMKFFIERRETHSNILIHIISIVRNLSVYKILVIIMVSISQIYLITKLFRGKGIDLNNPFNENENEDI